MKTFLAAALILNIVLAGALVRSVHRHQPVTVAAPAPAASTVVESVQPHLVTPSSVRAKAEDWQSWLEQLRAAGVPDKVLAGLVVSDFEDRWERELGDMQRRYHDGEIDADEMERFDANHDALQEQELKTALGNDGFLKWDKERVLRDVGSLRLSSSEDDALYQLRKDLAQKQREAAQAHSRGDIDEADFDTAQAAAQKEYDEKLKTLLGADRYAAMQNPDQPVKGDLARALKEVDATDAQFEALLSAQKQWNAQRAEVDRRSQTGSDQDGSYDEQIRAIDAARDAQYQRVLGTNGFDAFQKAQDSRYQTLQRYANAWQLSGGDVDHVYRALQYSNKAIDDYLQQARALEGRGEAVDWPKVEANIEQFSAQTQQNLRSYLGNDRFGKLQKNGVFESTVE